VDGPDRDSRRRWRGFWSWLVAALLVRIGTAALLAGKIAAAERAGFAKDAVDTYDPLVKSLLAGQGFAIPPWGATAFHVPVYPLLIAGSRLLLRHPQASVLAVQAVSGALVVALVFLLAQSLLGNKPGHLSAALALFYPDLMVYSLFNLSDMPYLALFLAGSVLLLWVARSSRKVRAVPLGVVLGLGALTRESAAGLAGLWLFVLAWKKDHEGRRHLKAATLAGVTFLLTILPWGIRNWVVFHEVIPLSTKGAQNFYEATVIRDAPLSGYREAGDVFIWPANDRERRVAERLKHVRSRQERDRIFLEAAAENLRSDPWAQLVHVGRKFLFLWGSTLGPRHAARVGWAPILWAAAVWHYGMLGLALAGFWRLRRNGEVWLVLLLPIAFFTMVHLLIGDAEPRYHLPAVPALLTAAASWVTSRWDGTRRDSRER
jgi:4-amino-4-deoxy-L-arabinose transferase-like glycosyltransferase